MLVILFEILSFSFEKMIDNNTYILPHEKIIELKDGDT